MPPHLGFFLLVAILLLVDLVLLPRRGLSSSPRVTWFWTAVLAAIAGGFALNLGATTGHQHAFEFVTGYLIEGSLSVDNLFVFLLLFRALHLKTEQQHRILLWGILGAILLRGLLILAGATLLARFAWIQYVFGGLLAVAAIRLLLAPPGAGPVHGPVRWIRNCCLRYVGGTLALRSLLLIILAVEATDLVFALDSIPAVLAVTRDPWIAFTSNIFAVLGLRSLYFALAATLDRFRLLHYGLACILGFVAFKMLAEHWITIPTAASLLIILGILAVFAGISRMAPPKSTMRSAHAVSTDRTGRRWKRKAG